MDSKTRYLPEKIFPENWFIGKQRKIAKNNDRKPLEKTALHVCQFALEIDIFSPYHLSFLST